MSKRVLFNEAEIAEPSDFNNATLFSQEATDALVGDAIAYPAHWAAMTVSATANAQEVRVSAGRYFERDTVFELTAAVDVNLQTHLPTVASDERWLALILRGTTELVAEDRFFETSTDPETSVPVSRPVPKVEQRRLSVIVQQGLATPAPAVRPGIAETDCCIAFVRVTSSGVQQIEMGEDWRVKPLAEVEGRVTALEVNLSALFIRTGTLETDLANLSAKVNGLPIPRPEVILQMRRDIAALRINGNVPEGARSDFYDPGLLPGAYDFQHVRANFRVREGIQFPFTHQLQGRLTVQEDNPLIRMTGRRMMPTFTETKRIFNEGRDATRDISNAVHTVTTAVARQVSHSAVAYGPTVNVCENAAEWASVGGFVGQTFNSGGRQFENVGVADAQYGAGHIFYGVREVSHYSWTETYWDYVKEEFGFNGSVYGQTFLVPQPMIATSIDLDFAKVGTEDGIKLFLCETNETGEPVVVRVLAANVTVTAAQLAAGGTGLKRISIPPTFLTPGRRYAWFTVTSGNHRLHGTTGNKFTGGTSFRLTDGIWAQGDQDFDFAFAVNGARFANTRTVIQFGDMSLDAGMTEFRLNYPNWIPAGTALEWEIRPIYGNGVELPWTLLKPKDPNPLGNLPARVQLRCTMLSTPDLAPMIELNDMAVWRTARTGSVLQAVTKPIDLGLSTTTVQTLLYVDNFDPDLHTLAPRIMAGPNVAGVTNVLIAPDITTTAIIDRPDHRAVLSTYTVPAGTRAIALAPGGGTQTITDVFFIENIAGFAL